MSRAPKLCQGNFERHCKRKSVGIMGYIKAKGDPHIVRMIV